MQWTLSLAGLGIGLLVGMTGMGGGSLMTPLLVLLFGFKPTTAIGTDILHGAIFKSFGAVQHRRLGNVDLRLALWMLAGSAPLSLAGVATATWLERRYGGAFELAARELLGVALVLCGIGFLLKAFLRARPARTFRMSARDRRIALATGLAGGFVVGLTSVGSGTFFGLVVMLVFPLSAAAVVGTDIFHAAGLLWVAGAGHLLAGNVDLTATAWLLLGSIPGVLLGGHVTVHLPERALRSALAGTLTLAGLELLDLSTATSVLLVAAAGAATATALLVRRGRRRRADSRSSSARGALAGKRGRQRAALEAATGEHVPELVGAAAGAEAGERG